MSDVSDKTGGILAFFTHAGYPAGLFTWLGLFFLIAGVLKENERLTWGGAALITLGLTFYYSIRWLGWVKSGDEVFRPIDWGALALFITFLATFAFTAYFFLRSFPAIAEKLPW